jgi:hypothetical protein
MQQIAATSTDGLHSSMEFISQPMRYKYIASYNYRKCPLIPTFLFANDCSEIINTNLGLYKYIFPLINVLLFTAVAQHGNGLNN